MKRLTLLFALSFVLLSFGLSNAVEWDTYIAPSNFWDNGGTPTLQGNASIVAEIRGGNVQDPLGLSGFNFNCMIYGTGDLTSVTLTGDYGLEDNEAFTPIIGLEEDWSVFTWGFTFYYEDGFDGVLPDTFAHSVVSAGAVGWDETAITTKYLIHMTLPFADETPAGELCFTNVVGHPNGDHDWLFPETATFASICYPVAVSPDLPPVVDCDALPPQMTTQHHVAFNLAGIPVSDPDGQQVTSVTATKGTVTYTAGAPTFSWTYDPPCSEVGQSVSVVFQAHNALDGPTCTVDLVVNNTAPEIAGDCGETMTVGTTSGGTAQFTATDDNSGDTKDWSITDFGGHPGPITVDPTGLVNFAAAAEGDYVVEVTVTDCAGDTDACTFTIHSVGELPFVIAIEKEEGPEGLGAYQGMHTQVDVVKVSGTEEIMGFDFLIAYDATALAFTGAIAGPMFSMAEPWEYFTFSYGPNGYCGAGCPTGMIQVVGIADQNNGPAHPSTFFVPDDTVLFSLDFLVSSDYTLECQYIPVQFFYMDCGDNSLAFHKQVWVDYDVRQAIATDVRGYDGTADGYLIPPTFEFPTFAIDTSVCINELEENLKKWPVPFITLFNGGVDIICVEDIDDRGDVNLNGVSYEIADAVVFTNYFLYGMAAFTINPAGQKAATDVNADGVILSVADLVYLIRVVVGDALPHPKINPVATPAQIAQNGDVLSVDAELGAAAFVVEGEVLGLASGSQGMELKTTVRDGLTYGVIYSFDKNATFSGEFLNINGRLASIEGANYEGAPMKFVALPTAFSVKNYPNPFNPTTTIEMALPVASNWTLSVYNVAGQKVKDFNGYSEAGTVKVVFDATSYASGIYFYKFQADQTEITKKMVLIK